MKHAPFREVYGRLHELRTLIQAAVPFVALTATAILETKKCIMDTLNMFNPLDVCDSPNKSNVTYSVSYIPQSSSIYDAFQWIIDHILHTQGSNNRVIIYCQTIKQCGTIYSILRSHLGDHLYARHCGTSSNPQPILEMLHSCTPQGNKDYIITSFQNADGPVKILVATISFDMGIDCKGVNTSVHFGPPKNVEAYLQEWTDWARWKT